MVSYASLELLQPHLGRRLLHPRHPASERAVAAQHGVCRANRPATPAQRATER